MKIIKIWSLSSAFFLCALCYSYMGQTPLDPNNKWHFSHQVEAFAGSPSSTSHNHTEANHIFFSLASLLDQLPNSLRRNGHTIVPAIVPAHTPLYHAFPSWRGPPSSSEWLAFEPEMSFGIILPIFSGTLDVTLYTYVSNRPLHVLYFDGSSAALDNSGTLDAQEVVIARRGGVVGGRGWGDDFARLWSLCKWARGKGIDGFIRMSTGFELMWCDFQDAGLDMVSALNVTVPEVGTRTHERPFKDSQSLYQDHANFFTNSHDMEWPEYLETRQSDPVIRSPEAFKMHGDVPKPPSRRTSDMFAGFDSEWLRIANRRYNSPQPFVHLIPSGFFTFYDPKLSSLVSLRQHIPAFQHRVWNISESDAVAAVDQIEGILCREDLWIRGGVRWEDIARRIVENWGDRLAQLNQTLHESYLNTTNAVRMARSISYTMLNPYLDTTTWPKSSTWHRPTIIRCAGSYTSFISTSSLTAEEQLLKESIEVVMLRLCSHASLILEGTLGKEPAISQLNEWATITQELMSWLDWSMWNRCDDDCGLNGMCLVSMWPVLVDKNQGKEPKPKAKCYKFVDIM